MNYVLAFFVLLLASCNSPPQKADHCLRLNIAAEPATLDPRKGGDLLSSHLHFMLFEGLTRICPNGIAEPAIAESIELSNDKKTYTFHLRSALWSDGSTITALDFENSWKDILSPEFPSQNANLLYPIKNAELAKKGESSPSTIGITALDAQTLQVTLENPVPYFLELVSFCVFSPVKSDLFSGPF